MTVDRIPHRVKGFFFAGQSKIERCLTHTPLNAKCVLYWENITVKVDILNTFRSIFKAMSAITSLELEMNL